MRVAHLVPNMNYGGLQELVRCLALQQADAGHAVSLLCWDHESNHPEVVDELDGRGIAVEGFREAGRSRAQHIAGLRRQIKADHVDVLHIHNPFAYALYGAVAATATPTKVVTTLHATAMFDRFSMKEKATFLAATRLTDRIVSVCDAVQDTTRQRYRIPARRMAVVDNGIDLTRFLAVPARAWRDDAVVFGAVGRMTPVKNHALLVEAFAKARTEHPSIRLRLLGGGADGEEHLKALVEERGIGDAVEFTGFSHDVPAFLAGLDVFALPSNSEGLSLSLLEAIASGLPVVATDAGGTREVVERTGAGWISPIGDIDALSASMCTAVVDTERVTRAEAARHAVVERYTVERMAAGYETVYRSL